MQRFVAASTNLLMVCPNRSRPHAPLHRAANESGRHLAQDPPPGGSRRHRDKDRLPHIRATGITKHLRNGGKIEIAQQIANHENARTTDL